MIENIVTVISTFIINAISSTGYVGVTVLMAIESAAIPLPSEIIMPFSGYLVFKGEFNFWLVSLYGTLGNVIGSLAAYYVGLRGGRPLAEKYGKYILISSHELDKADRWFKNYGQRSVFFSRLLPAVRTFISLPAGVARMNIWKFTLFTFLGSFPWSVGLTYIGYKMGSEWYTLKDYFHKFDIVIIMVMVGLIGWWVVRKIKSQKI